MVCIKNRIKIAVIDDHPILRETLMDFLSKNEKFNVTFGANNGAELLEKLKKNKVHLIILDLQMPVLDGWQTLKILSERYPTIKVIILSLHEKPEQIIEALKLGARAMLSKTCCTDNLIDAIYAVWEDGYYFDTNTAKVLHRKVLQKEFTSERYYKDPLTDRENQILGLICSGKTNAEIANFLYLSIRTVESHRKAILQKTECKNSVSLVVYAIKNQLIDLGSVD